MRHTACGGREAVRGCGNKGGLCERRAWATCALRGGLPSHRAQSPDPVKVRVQRGCWRVRKATCCVLLRSPSYVRLASF